MTLTIRPVAAEDRPVWEALFDGYAAFYKTEVTAEAKAAVWGWIHDPEEPYWADLAVLDGVAVGLVQYQLMHRSLSGAKVCYLSDLFTLQAARGKGAGRALIDHVIDFARENGISNVRWLTQEFNYAGRKLYDSYRPKSDFILYSVPVEG
jgi:GNAT superfamily N-acetyltransferase